MADPIPARGRLALGSRPWLHAFAVVVRSGTLEAFPNANTCIATTALGLHVLARYGIPARPASVWATALNRKAYLLSEQGVPVERWPGDAWAVGIDPRQGTSSGSGSRSSEGTGWDGHLVLLVRQPHRPRLLIDLTADQFDRPERGLRVEGPVFMDIPAGALWSPQDPLYALTSETAEAADGRAEANPTFVSYAPAPPQHHQSGTWKESPDWRRFGSPSAPEVAQAVDGLCARLDAYVRTETAGVVS